MSPLERPDYGVDAPSVVRNLAVIGAALTFLGLLGSFVPPMTMFSGLQHFRAAFLCPGISLLLTATVMFWGSRYGKLRFRDRVLDAMPWRGDEQVLDVGCGHGLMLIGAAKRLTTGRAIGIDLWQKEDRAGNSPEATLANARLEGVADRVEVRDADARTLPFADASFDVVLSSWALHNIYDPGQRAVAVREVARVLKSGGRAALIDIRNTAEYSRVLTAVGLDVRRDGPSFLFVVPTHVVWATKRDGGIP